MVLTGLGGGLVFSLVWMLVLRLCAGFIVWFTVLAANFLLLAVALYCYSKAGLITASGAVGKVGHPWPAGDHWAVPNRLANGIEPVSMHSSLSAGEHAVSKSALGLLSFLSSEFACSGRPQGHIVSKRQLQAAQHYLGPCFSV